MNKPNNKRRQQSREKIEKTFIELLQTRELEQITVSDICKLTSLNRSTFYANYIDIYDLADKLRDRLELEVASLFDENKSNKYNITDWIKLFEHMRSNQIFYKTYFKLGYDTAKINLSEINMTYNIMSDPYLEYHVEFFRAGFNAIVKKWLNGGCVESPEEMNSILVREYEGRDI